jgi:hypothetical protein
MRERFWSDDFDMDLLKVLPDLERRLGDAVDIPLWTYGNTTYGRLNCPAVWNGYDGFEAYFGTDDSGTWKPEGNWSSWDTPVVCTWLEVLRDVWVHHCIVHVDGRPVWNSQRHQAVFDRLMYHLRGWPHGRPVDVDKVKGELLASILAATADLRTVVTAKAGA